MTARSVLLSLVASLALSAHAGPAKPTPPAAPKPAAKSAPKAADAKGGDVAAMKRALASTGPARPADPAKMDPNAALEIRGQSRTLSMMLVLKGGKESINFIKVRKDYHDEILATPY